MGPSRGCRPRIPFLPLICVRVLAFAVAVPDVGVASKLFGNGASCYRLGLCANGRAFLDSLYAVLIARKLLLNC